MWNGLRQFTPPLYILGNKPKHKKHQSLQLTSLHLYMHTQMHTHTFILIQKLDFIQYH